MSFVYPGFLFGLLALSIPVIIHLFQFRRFRKVYFSNVRFLQQLSDESKKQSKLKHLLILLARMLALAALVMAFARPYIPVEDSRIVAEGHAVGVYIDNSFSMDALARQGRLLDEAKDRAREVASLYQPTDRFLLLTNDFEGRHQRFVSREEFLSMVDEVSLSPAIRTIGEVMERKQELFSGEPFEGRRAYLLSDFQKSTAGFDELEPDTTIMHYFLPLRAQRSDNVFVDSCWFETPVMLARQTATLNVRVRNDSEQSLENQPLRLYIDGVQRTVASYDLQPGGYSDIELSWTVSGDGIQQGYVEILDYPVTFDDRLYFSYRITTGIPVLTIDRQSPSPYLNALFGRDTTFSYSNMPEFSVDFSRFAQKDLIILNGLNRIPAGLSMELRRFVEEGGSLAVIPGENLDIGSYNEFLSALGTDTYSRLDTNSMRVTSLNELHELFTGVFEEIPENIDLPRTRKHYVLSRGVRSPGEYLMQLQNGNPFITAHQTGNGRVYLFSAPLKDEFSNFQRHAVFVPTLVNMALQSRAFQQLYHTIGDDAPLTIRGATPGPEQVFNIRGDEFEMIPEQRRAGNRLQLFVHDQLKEAGNYGLYSGESPLKGVSFNYDRRESFLETYSVSELEDLMRDHELGQITRIVDASEAAFGQALQEASTGRQLWRLFLILALAFLLTEVALLRFWK